MLRIGIVAEYNPFHRGHEYQIQYAKNVLKAEEVVVIMSGNFTQRGLPAICDKDLRGKAAVLAGADIVLEMPPTVAVADTPMFAQGAIDILIEYGCNALLFGSENDDLEKFEEIAEVFAEKEYWKTFDLLIQQGLTTDEARICIVKEKVKNKYAEYDFINQPNNLLGIYYISALIRRKANIKVFTNKRLGQNYFDILLPTRGEFASATAIRKMISMQVKEHGKLEKGKLEKYLPKIMCEGIEKAWRENALVFVDDFSMAYRKAMQEVSDSLWENICPQISREEVLHEIYEHNTYAKNIFLQYVSELKAHRMINWLLLGLRQMNMEEFLALDHIGWKLIASKDDGVERKHYYSEMLQKEWARIDFVYQNIVEEREL